MTSKKRKPRTSQQRRILRLERELAALEAEITRREASDHFGLAEQNHFILWQRPSLFVPLSHAMLH
jgi:hypothetical protein